jgi:hypothetical protein
MDEVLKFIRSADTSEKLLSATNNRWPVRFAFVFTNWQNANEPICNSSDFKFQVSKLTDEILGEFPSWFVYDDPEIDYYPEVNSLVIHFVCTERHWAKDKTPTLLELVI